MSGARGPGIRLRGDLEDDPITVRPAFGRSTVETAIRVKHHVAVRRVPVAAAEIMQAGIGPATAGGRELENVTMSIGAVLHRRSVKITRCSHSKVRGRAAIPGKAVEQRERPVAIGGRQLKDRAAAATPASRRRSVEIARPIHDETALGASPVISALKSIQDPAANGMKHLAGPIRRGNWASPRRLPLYAMAEEAKSFEPAKGDDLN